MATNSENRWGAIERESMRLSSHDNFGKPVTVHRTFAQISQQAKQLRENVGLVTTHSERAAASELLTGAVDTVALGKELGHFQVQPQVKHQVLDDAASVQEYVERLRQRNIQNTIETNMRESAERFDAFMERQMDSMWSSMRRSLLSFSMTSASGSQTSPNREFDRSESPAVMPAPSAPSFSPIYPSPTGKATFTPAQQELSKVIREYERAIHAGSTYSTLDEIKSVLEKIPSEVAGGSGPVNMLELLSIIKLQVSAVKATSGGQNAGSSMSTSQQAALEGSLEYMEAAYVKLIEQRVRSNRQSAMAGGTGSISSLIQGYIATTTRSAGGTMLVPPSRQSVAWQQVYHGLRSNSIEAAIDAADPYALAFSGCHHIATELQGWLQTWSQSRRRLSSSTMAEIERLAVGLVESQELEKQGVQLARSAVLVLCVLSGSIRPLTAATSAGNGRGQQALLPGSGVTSIEDWMWLRCSVAHSQRDPGLTDESALQQLQSDICAADAAQYTRDGTKPLHFVVVLLLSLQYRRAMDFLHLHPMCRELRIAAPALSLVIHANGLTTLGGHGDLSVAAGHSGPVNRIPATIMRQYARETYGLVTQSGWSRDSEAYLLMLRVAVDMQMQCDGSNSESDMIALLCSVLREWVVHTRDVGTQLDQEKLRLFEPNSEIRRRVLYTVAEDLRWDEPDMSGLLFALCGHHSKALEELNNTFSSRIRSLASATTAEQERTCTSEIQALSLRAHDLQSAFADYQLTAAYEISKAALESLADSVSRHWVGFVELQRIARIVEAHRALTTGLSSKSNGGGAPEAARIQSILREASSLQWLPVRSEDVARCASRAKATLMVYQRELLPITLVAVSHALSRDAATKSDIRLAQESTERKACLVQFAHLLNSEHGVDFLPHSVVRQLTEG